ncbi:hypothetical protein [Nocardioides sp. GXZ039]|uniref:hypothetical protein n=1 Tax=Nocardioides sp. GXZ039 TaxID=3136018 RepID=UPI0030F49A02
MRFSRGVAATAVLGAVAAGVAQSAPAQATEPSTGTGWHWVHEDSQPFVEGELTYPASRYCGTFDLKASPVRQDIRSRVLSRWDNGTAKDTYYTGPLRVRVQNATTGKSRTVDMGGDAVESDDPSGAMRTYQMIGPVGFGMPIGTSSGLPSGVYVLDGYHVARFDADGSRSLAVSIGKETNLCDLLR